MTGFALDVGGVWEGTSPNTQGDYLLPIPELQASFVEDPLFMYLPAQRVRATGGQVLGDVYEPYFDRTPRHFMGHLHAPAKPKSDRLRRRPAQGRLHVPELPNFLLLSERRRRCDDRDRRAVH